MEQANRITLQGSGEHSKRREEVWRVLVTELSKCALHSRQELTEAELAVYYESLRDRDPEALRTAIRRCRETQGLIPKIPEIEARYAEPVPPLGEKKLARDWYEPYNATMRLHYFEGEDGGRHVRIEPIERAITGKDASAGGE